MAAEPERPFAVRLQQVSFRWPSGRFALSVPDLSLRHGETVLLLGASGSGKSTLLSLVCGVNVADEGRIEVDGVDLGALRAGARDRFRAERIGVIFQMFNLLPYATPLENILLPLAFAPDRRRRAAPARDTALALTDALGLPRAAVTRATAATLSTGQQQRVAVARAMIGAPPLLVADEPTSALDADAQGAFLDLLFAQLRQVDAALLMVSHDARLADRFDRTVRLDEIAMQTRAAA